MIQAVQYQAEPINFTP